MSEANVTPPTPPESKQPQRQADDPLLNLVLFIAIVLVGLLYLEEVRPEWLARWLQTAPQSDIERLSNAIISQESNHNFQAINPDSGALGYAQIMPENLPRWSRDALGYTVTDEEFLANPELQRQIIEHRLNYYWQQALDDSGGDKERAVLMVASRWYSGDPDLYTSTYPQFYNGQRYPSIADYSQSILDRWQEQPSVWAQ
ncbi:MAG: transglycosylase SLT domain-containing protein [Cyanobacteria bacterium P01_H01_bin.121]